MVVHCQTAKLFCRESFLGYSSCRFPLCFLAFSVTQLLHCLENVLLCNVNCFLRKLATEMNMRLLSRNFIVISVSYCTQLCFASVFSKQMRHIRLQSFTKFKSSKMRSTVITTFTADFAHNSYKALCAFSSEMAMVVCGQISKNFRQRKSFTRSTFRRTFNGLGSSSEVFGLLIPVSCQCRRKKR